MDLLKALSYAAILLHNQVNPDIYPKDGFSIYGDLVEWMSNRTKEEMLKLFLWGATCAVLNEFGEAVKAHQKKVNADTDHK